MSKKIVLFDDGMNCHPFGIGYFVKESNTNVHYNRLFDGVYDPPTHISKKRVFKILDESHLLKARQIQAEFKKEYTEMILRRDKIITEWSRKDD